MSRSDDKNQIDDLGLEAFQGQPDDQGLSLNALSEAYAELLDRGDDPYEERKGPEPTDLADSLIAEEEEIEEANAGEGHCEVSPRGILEAILFVGAPQNQSLSSRIIASLMRGVRPAEIDDLVIELNDEYAEGEMPYEIVSEHGGYRLVLRDDYSGLRNKFYGRIREAKLSQAAIDILAIIAYRQPVTCEEVDRVRGRSSSAILNQLVRRQLLSVIRSEKKPRVKRYQTTERFLKVFGMEQLEDLPRSQEV